MDWAGFCAVVSRLRAGGARYGAENAAIPAVLFWVVAALFPCAASGQVVINEINYAPPDKTVPEEFVELYNAGSAPVDLSGWFFSDGIRYIFPPGVLLRPGGYIVIAEDPETIRRNFGYDQALGPYQGRLSNEGEIVCLRSADGAVQDLVRYGVGFPWPVAACGEGSSLELINPSLDNSLGANWRPSGLLPAQQAERVYFVRPESPQWHYRKGTSEASDPADKWRLPGFSEDESWLVGQTVIGYGNDPTTTKLEDMRNGYTSVYFRHTFTVESEENIPVILKLGLFVDDGAVVWINGVEVARIAVAQEDPPYDATASRGREPRWEFFFVRDPSACLRVGENVLAAQGFNIRLSNVDFSFDAQLFVPGAQDQASDFQAPPTPGRRNTVWSENAPPAIRNVKHTPQQPHENEAFVVTAEVTDPDGVQSVALAYQVVLPGQYIPSRLPLPHNILLSSPDTEREINPAFEDPANWVTVPMRDDGTGGDRVAGDHIYTVTLPGQINRTLVRYRITAVDGKGMSVRVPYPDDPSLNFACFVYNGVPPYVASRRTVHREGPGYSYPVEVMTSLPVYILITRKQDYQQCVAYNSGYQIPKSNEGARDKFNWNGTFVYRGIVYDHIKYRLRQANDRYGGRGKRDFRFRFNKGHYFQAYDNYGRPFPKKWRTINTGKMFDNKRVGNFGLTETMNHMLWNMVGVPAPYVFTFHFRVVQGADEVPPGPNGQYLGDFWGMALCFEDYDARFIETHNMPDGNLYKLKDGVFDGNELKRNQGRYSVKDDSDFQNIRHNLRPNRSDEWLNKHVNWDEWNRYHAVVEAIRHYDFKPSDTHSKNRAWFFEPYPGSPYGRLWLLPWDSDASWGPNWNQGIDYPKNAIFSGRGREPYKMNYRNNIREFRDLIWTREVIEQMIDDLAERIREFAKADRDRWRGAPPEAGYQDFGSLEAKVADMKRFAFVGWSGSTGPTVPAGGRARHLDNLAAAEGEAAKIPETPTVTYVGPAGYPMDALRFRASEFSDPQGDSFGAMRWRIGEITPPGTPFNPKVPRKYEWPALWEREYTRYQAEVTIPKSVVRPGGLYRVRVRMKDSTGRWSHWSEPVEFKAGEPLEPIPALEGLRITEVMYHPKEDFGLEFIEIANVGTLPVDLTEVSIRGTVSFSFSLGTVGRLESGSYLLVVRNRAVFYKLLGSLSVPIAGEFQGELPDTGGHLQLVYGSAHVILDFTYDPSWYPETAGRGRSLVIRNETGPRELWAERTGWRPSRDPGGSPGEPDPAYPGGLQRKGDLNQDGRLTVSDAVSLLRLLYGHTGSFPCGEGTLEEESNRVLYDLNGDGSVNVADIVYLLAYLYTRGPAPVGESDWLYLPGCPDAPAR